MMGYQGMLPQASAGLNAHTPAAAALLPSLLTQVQAASAGSVGNAYQPQFPTTPVPNVNASEPTPTQIDNQQQQQREKERREAEEKERRAADEKERRVAEESKRQAEKKEQEEKERKRKAEAELKVITIPRFTAVMWRVGPVA
jgi:hypothetical protein